MSFTQFRPGLRFLLMAVMCANHVLAFGPSSNGVGITGNMTSTKTLDDGDGYARHFNATYDPSKMLSNDGRYVIIPYTGLYQFQFACQYIATDPAAHTAEMYWQVQGTHLIYEIMICSKRGGKPAE